VEGEEGGLTSKESYYRFENERGWQNVRVQGPRRRRVKGAKRDLEVRRVSTGAVRKRGSCKGKYINTVMQPKRGREMFRIPSQHGCWKRPSRKRRRGRKLTKRGGRVCSWKVRKPRSGERRETYNSRKKNTQENLPSGQIAGNLG